MPIENHVQSLAERVLKCLLPSPRPSKNAAQKAKIIAHRGLFPGYKENSLAGFTACKNAGIWGVEFDIRWTKDLVPIVFHDSSTTRVFKTNYIINDIFFNDLNKVHPEISTLKEVVEKIAPECHLMIELKDPLDTQKNNILSEILRPLTPTSQFHFMSLNINILNTVHRFPKDCLLSIALFNPRKVLKGTLKNKIGGMTGSYLLLTNSYKKQLEQQNMFLGTGYIDSEYALYRELNRGVEHLFSNKAFQIMHILQEIQNS